MEKTDGFLGFFVSADGFIRIPSQLKDLCRWLFNVPPAPPVVGEDVDAAEPGGGVAEEVEGG